jgi:hypothetical protein
MGAHHHHKQDNPNFVFDTKLKLFTLILIVIGAVSLALTYFTGGANDYIRFWTNLLHNTAFFTGIAFASLFFLATHTVAWGGWQTIFKRVPEAMMMFLPVGIILFGLIAAGVSMDATGTDFLYLWSDESALKNDKLVIHKSAFLNPFNYLLTLVVIGLWTLFAWTIRKLSIQQDGDRSLRKVNYEKIHMWSAIFLPIAGFSSAYAIWQWVMSVDTHWYSTLFAWYATVSVWISAICIMYLLILFLKSKGHLQNFTKEHTHDLGKYVFGFSVFWTYLWFSQFMLIWYANNGEETQYFFLRFEQFRPIFFINLFMNFVIPFLTLMMNSAKRATGTLGFMASLVLLGHWVDYYQMIKPGVWYNWEHTQHAKHEHGHDKNHDHKNHKHDDHGHKDEHSHTYKLNNENTPKAVFTDFQNNDKNKTNESPKSDSSEKKSEVDSTKVTTPEALEHKHENDTNHNHVAVDHSHENDHAHHSEKQFLMGIHFPGLYELGTLMGFIGLFLFVTFFFLEKSSLTPKNDPYFDESMHHHVWYDL